MNVQPSSSSDATVSTVTSKYFSSKTGMDDSLSDFKEKKKNCAGPKKTKPTINKPKKLKRPKGQKDIRTVLKKNELVAYSKEFDNVCKQSGIDVDPEQLQLAVALSKSLQPEENEINSQSQGRTARIRTTLQEYGFKVPEIKITNKKLRKCKKKYKLLELSDAEKQQIISDRYSQVLFQSIDAIKHNNHDNKSNAKLYYLTSSVPYEEIKNNDTFYINNLSIEKSNFKGSLLRDWSDIPGRPVSPKLCVDLIMDISEITCSQDELDAILSGGLKNTKNIICNKVKETFSMSRKNVKDSISLDLSIEDGHSNIESDAMNTDIENSNCKLGGMSIGTARSCSPDLFDDENTEDIIVTESPSQSSKLPEEKQIDIKTTNNASITISECAEEKHPKTIHTTLIDTNVTTRKSNDIMDLTDCVTAKKPFQSQENISCGTNMHIYDFMDLTECVPHFSQSKIVHEKIDLTQNNNISIIHEEEEGIMEPCNIESMDLTQSSDSNDLPYVQVSDTKTDETIMMNDINLINVLPVKTMEEPTVIYDEEKDLTGNITPVKSDKNSSKSSFDEFLYDHSDDGTVKLNDNDAQSVNFKRDDEINLCKDTRFSKEKSIVGNNEIQPKKSHENESEPIKFREDDDIVNEDIKENEIGDNKSRPMEFGKDDDIIFSEDACSSKENKIVNELQPMTFKTNDVDAILSENINYCSKQNITGNDEIQFGKDDDDTVNLTQDSSSSERKIDFQEHQSSNRSLGKDNNISIDYDEILNENNLDNISNYDKIESTSQEEVFEISDNEFNYSIQSHFGQPDFGGISIMDNTMQERNRLVLNNKAESTNNETVEKIERVNNKNSDTFETINYKSYNMNDTLPQVDIKGKVQSAVNPYKDMYDKIKTPNNKEYIIKTEEVTPLADYASMSTPERNKELDKYGLKPLKRKRAVQILTHIYNQTHPVVEPCLLNDMESPSKKQKKETKSPKKIASPRKTIKSPQKSPRKCIVQAKENIYDVTNERVDVREIADDGDWVFQKREKAKVHSCRVPLHIAFYNYVHCHRWLREAILRYEPVNIDVIHKDLVANGYRYDPKDLLKFLDKKCITVKTTDNNSRNHR